MKRKALVVEDNENNRYLLTLLLEDAGFSVFVAIDGVHGVEMARTVAPDVILLDIQMPDMDGYEVASRLQSDSELARIPIVGVSSFAMPGDREKAMKLGFAGYIEKPVDPEQFAETVMRLLAGVGGRDESSECR